MKRIYLALILSIFSLSAFSAATISFNYIDGATEGFNDTGAPLAASTAPGATIGAQRKASFEAAVNAWGGFITSSVTIVVDSQMDPLTCTSGSAILGSAGSQTAHRDFAGSVASTWYPQALANKLSAVDNSASNDINATFNSDIDGNPNCLGDGGANSVDWFYATSAGGSPPNTTSFYDTVLHEVGHGLGFSSFVNPATGTLFNGLIDIYSSFLEDHSTGESWGDVGMTDGERMASAIDTSDLHWTGPAVTAAIGALTAGTSGGHVQMYAPSPLESGSSVSHWDTAFKAGVADELMEPSATAVSQIIITDELLEDIGWGPTLPVELQSFEIE